MTFEEFRQTIFNPAPPTSGLEYKLAMLWLNPSLLPVGVVSLGNVKDKVIKIPELYLNQWGCKVPVIMFAGNVFRGQEEITDVILSRFIERIPRGSFIGCKNLKRISIPKSIRSIQEGTFTGCENLEDVYYEGSEDEWKQIRIIYKCTRVKDEKQLGLIVDLEEYIKPGNEHLLNANIHFNCNLKYDIETPVPGPGKFVIKIGNDDATDAFRLI